MIIGEPTLTSLRNKAVETVKDLSNGKNDRERAEIIFDQLLIVYGHGWLHHETFRASEEL